MCGHPCVGPGRTTLGGRPAQRVAPVPRVTEPRGGSTVRVGLGSGSPLMMSGLPKTAHPDPPTVQLQPRGSRHDSASGWPDDEGNRSTPSGRGWDTSTHASSAPEPHRSVTLAQCLRQKRRLVAHNRAGKEHLTGVKGAAVVAHFYRDESPASADPQAVETYLEPFPT